MHFQHSPIKTVGGVRENAQNRRKNGNDLGDLDFDLETLRSSGYVDLVYTYLWYEYDDYQRTLRKRAKPAKTEMTLVTLMLTL